MGWGWKEDKEGEEGRNSLPSLGGGDGEMCSTTKMVKTECKTEEVEPGKLVRKCGKTEEILRHCVGKPVEVLKSNKEYTEEDITDMVTKGSSLVGKDVDGPFNFPGLQSDIENMESHFLGEISRFFEAVEEMKNSFFNVFGDFHDGHSSSSSSMRRRKSTEGTCEMEASHNPNNPSSGDVDLSGLAREV